MSLAALLIRSSIVKALGGNTQIAGNRVVGAEQGKLSDLVPQIGSPLVRISVVGGEGKTPDGPFGLVDALDIAVDIAVAPTDMVVVETSDGATSYTIAPVNGGEAAVLDMLWYEVLIALNTPTGGAWADIWKRLLLNPNASLKWQRESEEATAGAYFARTYKLSLEPVAEPIDGSDGEVWQEILATMVVEPDLAPIAGAAMALMDNAASHETLVLEQASLGVSADAFDGLGLSPASDQDAAFVSVDLGSGAIDETRLDEVLWPEEGE